MAAMRAILMVGCAAVLVASARPDSSIHFPREDKPQLPKQQPEQPQEPQRQLVFRSKPVCAENASGVCEDPDEPYPIDIVKNALSLLSGSASVNITRGDEPLLGTRFGSSVHEDSNLLEETAACAASESIIYPKMAENLNGDWLYVANIEGHVVQGIRVEKCVDENKPCKIGEGSTVCRQKYIYRKLLAVGGDQKITVDNFRIPSACVCFVKNEFLQLGNRFFDKPNRNATKSTGRKRRQRRQSARQPELEVVGGETEGLTGSPLDNTLAAGAAEQGTAQQSIETEDTLNPSDTIGGQPFGRYAGEIIVHSNPIIVQKKPPKSSRRRN